MTETKKNLATFAPTLALAASTLCWPMATIAAESETKKPLNGAEIYHDNCSVCHGDRGNGRSRAQGSFLPSPRDFTAPKAAKELTRDRMIFSVNYGRPDTAMASWGVRLSNEEVGVVVDYIRTTFMKLDEEKPGNTASIYESIKDGEIDPLYMGQEMPYGLVGNADWGKMFYNTNCAECHGVDGDGKGPRAYFILPKPRDYRHPAARHKLNRPRLFEVISTGSRGTEMPAWDKVLTFQEIAHVSEYIFQAFIEPEKKD